MQVKNKVSRKFDPLTMTYSFSDGSGTVTEEQVQSRKLLASRIEELKVCFNGSLAHGVVIAGLTLEYLTFFKKPNNTISDI